MKSIKKCAVGLLAATIAAGMLLSGCGTPKKPETADEMLQNAVGLNTDDIVMTVNGAEINAATFCFWLNTALSEVEYYFSNGIEWDVDLLGDGTSIADYAKGYARDAITQFQVIEAKAAEYGIELGEDGQKELDAIIADYVTYYGGDEALDAQLACDGLTRDVLLSVNKVPILYNGLFAKLTEGYDTVPEDTTALEEMITEYGYLKAKHILLSNEDEKGNELDDAGKAEKLALAESLLAQINASADPIATFEELMLEHGEDPGVETYPDGYIFFEGDMVKEFETAVMKLEENAISEVVTSDYGYHIILRLPVTPEDVLADFAALQVDELFIEWLENAEITTNENYNKIDPKKYYDYYCAINQAE